MSIWENIKIAVFSIRTNMMRSILTMLGIIIGVASVIAIITVGNGGKDFVVDLMSDMSSGAVSIQVSTGASESERITKEDIEDIKKIETIKYVRENKIPFLGICLGMQMAVVEFARNVLGLKDANSTEFDSKTKEPVIHIMEEQKGIDKKGGTMRLGSYPCKIKEGTLAYELYGKETISERHRHRYEYNNEYKERLEKAGLICSGTSPDGGLVEIVEIENHPYFVASQFHPEFKSRPNNPAPLFVGLIKAAKQRN